MNFKQIFNQKNRKLRFVIVGVLATLFFLYESTESILVEKLENNQELLRKFNEFKEGGYERDIKLSRDIIESVIDTAKSYVGVPNKVGGISRDSIDASGLIYVSINANTEFKFPRIAQEMARYGKIITKKDNLKKETWYSFMIHMK